jgi:type I restriction enzyme M protein
MSRTPCPAKAPSTSPQESAVLNEPGKTKPITLDMLAAPQSLVRTLFGLENVMRSHGVNDEHARYKEALKLLLARYADEKLAGASGNRQLSLQVFEGGDPGFMGRVNEVYKHAACLYGQAQTLYHPEIRSALGERTLRDLVCSIQGLNLSSASSESMQQIFMSFVPAILKKNLDQFFTPASLTDAMVEMAAPGPLPSSHQPNMLAAFLMSSLGTGGIAGMPPEPAGCEGGGGGGGGPLPPPTPPPGGGGGVRYPPPP